MRPNYVIVLVGARRTGKTTELVKLIDKCKKKVLIYDINNEKIYRKYPQMNLSQLPAWRSGKYRIFAPPEVMLEKILECSKPPAPYHLRNTAIILDDASKYIFPNSTRMLKDLLVSCRHWNQDIFLTFHSISVIPPEVFTYTNYLLIKKTSENIKKIRSMDKVPNPEEVIKAWEAVVAHKDQYYQKTVLIQP